MIDVDDQPNAGRYEITEDGDLAGFLTYRLSDGVITFLHAEIEPAREGRGLGGRLVHDALDDARARGLAVRPLCPFVAHYIRRNAADYGDLVAS